MIEVIYKDEMQKGESGTEDLHLPKNIRQIGQIRNDCRIYMEDYVYTFLGKAAQTTDDSAKEDCCLAILTGQTQCVDGISYVFICGALLAEEKELSREHVEFSDQSWQKILEETETFFEGQKIVGWFFAGRSLPLEMTEVFQKVHRRYFGAEKVLMLMDAEGREEAFFRYENSFLIRQTGYYLYYEKNPQMQAYMLEKFPGTSESRSGEAPDEAVHTFRRIIRKKKGTQAEDDGQNTDQNKNTDMEEETEGHASVFSYAAAACLVLAVASVGVRFYQNYQQKEKADARLEAVSAASRAADGETAEEEAAEDETAQEESAEAEETDTEETVLVTSAPEISAVPSAGASPLPTAGTQESQSEKTALSEQEEQIYREEADDRKAERRIREGEAQEEETSEMSAETSAGTSYVIRPGDTLYQISVEKYGSMDAVQEICELNGFSEDEIIYPGQIIVLP